MRILWFLLTENKTKELIQVNWKAKTLLEKRKSSSWFSGREHRAVRYPGF